MHTDFEKLKAHLAQIGDLNSALALCYWDQATYLPEAAHSVRAEQISTLTHIVHKMSVSAELGNLIKRCAKIKTDFDSTGTEAAILAVAEKDFKRYTQVPDSFMAEMSQHYAGTYSIWAKAREANDYSMVSERLEKTLDLSRQHASFFKGFSNPHDALIEGSDAGIKSEDILRLFAELRTELVPLLKTISERPQKPHAFAGKKFSVALQKEISKKMMSDMGFPWKRGRMDDTHHPFMVRMASDDCRITIRSKEENPLECIFSAIHEMGHAFYELGIDPAFDRTPLGSGTSMSVHESQSRFWENILGRSKAFWTHYYPVMKDYFPGAMSGISFDDFYHEVNRVEPSLIRTDADEVTYNLHVMIRFDLEAQMLSGKLAVKDLPQAWNARYKSDLGIDVPSNKNGCLQDMHWYAGGIGGYFQSYTLGNIISGTLLEQVEKDIPQFWSHVEKANFAPILTWLGERIHRHGRKFSTHEIVKQVSGKDMRVEPFVNYLKKKYL